MGFGRLGGGTFAHPSAPFAPVVRLLGDLELLGRVILLRGRHPGVAAAPANEELARRCSDLDAIEAGYREVIERYEPVLAAVLEWGAPDPTAAFLARTLLMHDYRRLVLRDPQLPDDLLPDGWAGDEAHQTVALLYRAITRSAEAHLERVAQTVGGSLPPLLPAYRDRFLSV
jgi:phenylacetic acid degradation operon negative regulatory protein